MRLIQAGESTAARRRVYFDLRMTDGITPATGEAGGQPQVSIDGAAWADAGIGTLAAIGNGRYYAVLDASTVASAGSEVESRYKSAGTAECPGQSAQVVGFDPASAFHAGEVESGVDLREAISCILAATAGVGPGGTTGVATWKNPAGDATRVSGTVTTAGRTSSTLTPYAG